LWGDGTKTSGLLATGVQEQEQDEQQPDCVRSSSIPDFTPSTSTTTTTRRKRRRNYDDDHDDDDENKDDYDASSSSSSSSSSSLSVSPLGKKMKQSENSCDGNKNGLS